jgi:hypothetical protein
MNTTVLIESLSYKLFKDRCHNIGLDYHRSLSSAIYLRMSKAENWSDDATFEESCFIHNRKKEKVEIYLADSFFQKWRVTYQPFSTSESAAIGLCMRDFRSLALRQSHDADYMLGLGMVLTSVVR